MAELLRRWAEQHGDKNPFANHARIRALQGRIAASTDPGEIGTLQSSLATELLNVGQPEAALAAIQRARDVVAGAGQRLHSDDARWLRELEGLASLRLGELDNCLQHHNADSCLLPIQGGGQHLVRRGSEQAEKIFLETARRYTNDLGARWLANIAAMTLGKYPDGVPPALLIPPATFASEYPMPRFPEIAIKVGLTVNDIAGGTIVEDFDGDGMLDVMFSSWDPLGQCRVFRNLGGGLFSEVTEAAGLIGVTGGLNLMQTDYNNDGWPDVYIVRGAWFGELGLIPDSLLKNNGDGTFADVTEEAGLLTYHPALSAAWFDANNDGWLDLFVGNETQQAEHPHPCALFLNNRNGTFTEGAAAAGVAIRANVKGVTAGDFDNDGWTDLYLSCLGQPNVLLRNTGSAGAGEKPGVRFTDVTSRAGVAQPLFSFPTWFWDHDNDGWLDLFVCGYTTNFSAATLTELVADKLGRPSRFEKMRLYRNNRDGTFADVTQAARLDRAVLAMGANFGDLDNDGWLDLYLGTGNPNFNSLLPNEMFRNDHGRRFQNVTTAGGFGHLQKGHGVAFADLNNDGQQEVVINIGGAYAGDNYFDAVFANPGNSNAWVTLKLVGRESNRAAIGARITVVAATPGGERQIHRVVGSGGSFGSSPLRQEIGLGDAIRIARVEVRWPVTGRTNVVTGLEPRRFYELTEGEAAARSVERRRFNWELGAAK